jgi:hypothetical protein
MNNLRIVSQTIYHLTKTNIRWIGFILAAMSVGILSSTILRLQWFGWFIGAISCTIWIMISFKDQDKPRTLMECMYLGLSVYACYNWFNYE